MNDGNRIYLIDSLRGFSLLGILLANLLIFQYGIWGKDYIELFNISSIDKTTYAFVKLAIEESFMPIFAFLFGYSLIMMRNRLKENQMRIKWHLFRRALVLIIFGILHSTFLWEGDILFLYGSMSVFLLLFVNRKAKTLLIWIIILTLLLGAGDVLNLLYKDSENNIFDAEVVEKYVNQTNDVYSNGTYAEIKEHRNHAEDPLDGKLSIKESGILMIIFPFMIAPLFLLGMYAGNRKWFFNPVKEKRFYLLGFICLPIGIILKAIGYFLDVEFILGGELLALGYILLFSYLYSSAKFKHAFHLFQNIGKLSLTNYLMQTVICTTIFYGYGLGMFNKLGVFWATLLGFIIFSLQVLFSTFYLKHFRYGPFEKIIRMCTNLSLSGKRKSRVSKMDENNQSELVV